MRKYLYIVGILLTINIGIFWYIKGQFLAKGINVSFLSVGQGDASLISTRNVRILIDAGPSAKTVHELDRLMPVGNRVIDCVIITHANVDHFYGLLELIKHYQVRLVMVSGIESDDAKFDMVMSEVVARGIPVIYGRQDQEIIWDQARIKIVWPDFRIGFGESVAETKLNDNSIVTQLSYGEFDVLFTGDISARVEKEIGKLLGDIEILKVAHHGSKYSTTDLFLDILRPELAVIPVGKNRYGHPSADVLQRLKRYTSNIFDTLSSGTVTIISDGLNYSLAGFGSIRSDAK